MGLLGTELVIAAPVPLFGGGNSSLTVGYLDILILVAGFAIGVWSAYTQVYRIMRQYVQALYDLSDNDADMVVGRMVSGSSAPVARGPALKVRAGKADIEGPPLIYKIGGPAKLDIDHDSAVVTSRFGTLWRVLGPGQHRLEPFERVWDAVDLRPQRRTITVAFMTRDGIPASCQATVVCRIASRATLKKAGDGARVSASLPDYSDDVVLEIVTSKHMRVSEKGDHISDWVVDLVYGPFENTVRDVLEQYRLDEFLNPQYWLEEGEDPPRAGARPKLVPELEAEIERRVRLYCRAHGVLVERVELGIVRADEASVSQQWLEFWRAKLQQGIDRYMMQTETMHKQLAANALTEVRAQFIERMLEELRHLSDQNVSVPPRLIVAGFLEVLHTMCEYAPAAQRVVSKQLTGLTHMTDAIQGEGSTSLRDDSWSEERPA